MRHNGNADRQDLSSPRRGGRDKKTALTNFLQNLRHSILERPYYAAAYVVLFFAAAGMRFWDLGFRAVHHDESLHAYYSWNLFDGNGYIHNPMMHGPFQMEATAGLFFIFGDSDYTSRLLYAIAGTALVLMPLLFRSRLGNWGALIISVMLAFSPAMLYYSRFARNDILMAVWALGIVIAMWRYLDEGSGDTDSADREQEELVPVAGASGDEDDGSSPLKGEESRRGRAPVPTLDGEVIEGEDEGDLSAEEAAVPPPSMGKVRYLYITAALLAFAFASKESAYLITATMGLYLGFVITSRNWEAIRSRVVIGEDSPPAAVVKMVQGGWSAFFQGLEMRGVSKETGFLVLLITITLPLWGAFISFFQHTPLLDWSGLILASPVGGNAEIGAPERGGLVVAFLVTALLIFLGLLYGLKWNQSVWWKAAAVFYVLFILMYTTFFTNMVGIGSGVWQSLGYWVVQQGEARGGQPWYYYFVVTTVYEFLPFVLAIVASVYYVRKRDKFGLFLVYWVWMTFLLYTVASEKMPWLLVNITLPMIVLSGKFLNDLIVQLEWKPLIRSGGVLVLPGVPIFLVLLWNLAFVGLDGFETIDVLLAVALGVVVIALAATGYLLARRIGRQGFATLGLVSGAAVLLILSGRASITASFENGDVPIEMIVYTQTSPDIHRLARQLRDQDVPEGAQIVAIDGTSGFHWPWYWYLRGKEGIGYTTYGSTGSQTLPNAPIALVHSNNKNAADESFTEAFSESQRIRHRWWFPEVYRGATMGKVIDSLTDRQVWRDFADYFLYRNLQSGDGMCIPAEDQFSCLGSENAYIYQSPDSAAPFIPKFN
jgi:predicted membrane-bound mannosyltransferase